jgi:hypothetical protein
MENQKSKSGEAPDQNGRQRHPECTAPKEGVTCVNTSINGLVDQCGTPEASPSQLPEGPSSCIATCKVTDESTCVHFTSFQHHSIQASGYCNGSQWRMCCESPLPEYHTFMSLSQTPDQHPYVILYCHADGHCRPVRGYHDLLQSPA